MNIAGIMSIAGIVRRHEVRLVASRTASSTKESGESEKKADDGKLSINKSLFFSLDGYFFSSFNSVSQSQSHLQPHLQSHSHYNYNNKSQSTNQTTIYSRCSSPSPPLPLSSLPLSRPSPLLVSPQNHHGCAPKGLAQAIGYPPKVIQSH